VILTILIVSCISVARSYGLDSLTVTDVSFPATAQPSATFSITVTVKFSLSTSENVEVWIYDYDLKDYLPDVFIARTLRGDGVERFVLSLHAPNNRLIWHLSAATFYGLQDNLQHYEGNWYRDFDVVILPVVTMTTVTTTVGITQFATATYTVTSTQRIIRTVDAVSAGPLSFVCVALFVVFLAALVLTFLRGRNAQKYSRTEKRETRYVEYLAKLDALRSRGEVSEQTYLRLKKDFLEKLEQG